MLCGLARPGHFDGVATVVAKLFNQVTPDVAVFGEKDFQQLAVIRRLVNDLAFAVEIVGHPTMRDVDGLALSSRNNYLSPDERATAPLLYQALSQIVEQVTARPESRDDVLSEHKKDLDTAGFQVEYVDIRRQTDLKLPEPGDKSLVVLAAARLGQTRLIDNVAFELE